MVVQQENLGPAERIIQTVLAYSDHMVHNRPGFVVHDGSAVGVRWAPATYKLEGDAEPKQKVVYAVTQGVKQRGAKRAQQNVQRLGVLNGDGRSIVEAGRRIGEYREAGLFPEVAVWLYKQIATVWQLDNEFAAHWASFAFGQEHKDLKVALAAFMLCQSRKGDPIFDNGKVAFMDADFRDVGEAMLLLQRKDGKDIDPKLLARVGEMLMIPGVVQVNRDLGFAKTARDEFLGRWPKAVARWLQYREENPKLLKGLMKAGFRTTVTWLAHKIGYKPTTPLFFEQLRWKQKQAKDGRRGLAIGKAVKAAESWKGLSEREICERIQAKKPSWKLIVSLVPTDIGITRAIMAAAIEAESLSDKDLIILTPTIEELGLLDVQDIKARWEAAAKRADDMRAANIAKNVRTKEVKEKLEEAADTALKAAVEEVAKNIRVYVMVDASGSMEGAIEAAKSHLAKFIQGFPMDRVHVASFNTTGIERKIPHASAAGVNNAFVGVKAGGGTSYGEGVKCLSGHRPKDDEDVVFIFVGDEEGEGTFADAVRRSGLRPLAFGFVKVCGPQSNRAGTTVRTTAAQLGLPCFLIDERTFEDVYAIPRTMRALVAATPVTQQANYAAPAPRLTLVDQILKTDLLKKPAWALPEVQPKAAKPAEVLL